MIEVSAFFLRSVKAQIISITLFIIPELLHKNIVKPFYSLSFVLLWKQNIHLKKC